jgi:RNA polymerase sigma-70 factor (ECF subfamily)
MADNVDPVAVSDEALMQSVCADDSGAFEQLVLRYQGRLFHFALHRLRDRQAAEDVVQETLLKVWRHRHSFRQGARLSTWIFTLCLNLVRDHWRRGRPEASMDLPAVAREAEASAGRTRQEDASDAAYRHELADLIVDALQEIPARSAELLRRRSEQGTTLEESGAALGLGPDAARAAASRAYKKLKHFLKKRMD